MGRISAVSNVVFSETGQGVKSMNLALTHAVNAIELGSCLEVYFAGNCILIDPQMAGLDREGHPIVLGVERLSERGAPLAQWFVLRLDKALRVDVSGYLSDGPRCGWDANIGHFAQVAAAVH